VPDCGQLQKPDPRNRYRQKYCGQAHEKGCVENAAEYFRSNFLAGLELSDVALINSAAPQRLETVASRAHWHPHDAQCIREHPDILSAAKL